MVREIFEHELERLLELYLNLHEKSIPDMSQRLNDTWDKIIHDENHHIIVNEITNTRLRLLTKA